MVEGVRSVNQNDLLHHDEPKGPDTGEPYVSMRVELRNGSSLEGQNWNPQLVPVNKKGR